MDDTDHALFPRFSAELVATALKDTPVVMVTGPRQCGKTTLVRDLVAGKREFITMDDDTVLAAARSDPTGLVRALDRTTIDEVQRVPDLLRAIKKSVDDDRRAFVFSEVLKQASWSGESCALYHYRDKDQDEVDLVIETGSGALVGIEVKASATVNAGDFRGLRKLAEACGDNFKLGVVLYDGGRPVPFGDRLVAAPMSCLWA